MSTSFAFNQASLNSRSNVTDFSGSTRNIAGECVCVVCERTGKSIGVFTMAAAFLQGKTAPALEESLKLANLHPMLI
jgi:hypothetical protein